MIQEEEDIRSQITALLAAKDPAKVPKIDALLARYAGHEDALLAALKRKYEQKESASAAAATLSTTNLTTTGPSAVVPTEATAPVEDRLEPYRKRLHRLYVAHCPGRVPFVDHDLKKYPGREEDVIQAAAKRFGPEPPLEDVTTATPAATPEVVPEPPSSINQPSTDAAAPKDSYLARLTRIYQRYAPERVSQAPRHLEKYAGHEEEVIRAAVRHFGPEPDAGDVESPSTEAAHVVAPTETQPVPSAVSAQETSGDAAQTQVTEVAPLSTTAPDTSSRLTTTTTAVEAFQAEPTSSGAAALPAEVEETQLASLHASLTEQAASLVSHDPGTTQAMADESLEPATAPAAAAAAAAAQDEASPLKSLDTTSSAPPSTSENYAFTFVPTPQPVQEETQTYTTAFEITPMEEQESTAPELSPPLSAEAVQHASEPAPAHVVAPAVPVPSAPAEQHDETAIATEPGPEPESVTGTHAEEADTVTPDKLTTAAGEETECSLAETVKPLFRSIETLTRPDSLESRRGATRADCTVDGETCAYLICVALGQDQPTSSSSPPPSAMTEDALVAAIAREVNAAGTTLNAAAGRLRRAVSRLVPRDLVTARSVPVSSSQPRCFWCHWCILPSVEARWRRAWVTLLPASQLLRICYPNSTRVELPITFAHILACRRDSFATLSGAPRAFATNGVRLTFSSDAVPLELLLCLEHADDAEALVAAYRAHESEKRRRQRAESRAITANTSATPDDAPRQPSPSSLIASGASSTAPALSIWWCSDNARTFHLSRWSLCESGTAIQVTPVERGEDTPKPFPSWDAVAAAVDSSDIPLLPKSLKAKSDAHGFALALRDNAFVYCCASSQTERMCAMRWVKYCLARRELLRVPVTQW